VSSVASRQAPLPAPTAGRGELVVIRTRDGRSAAERAYATSPLRLLTPRNHGHAAWIYTSSYGGGLVDGDHLSLDVDIGTGASAFVSTQSATKVFRGASGAGTELHARIGSGGLLVFAPDPVVCFAASRYRQVQHLDLAAGSGLVLVDWLSSGRHTCGERWAFDGYSSRLRVHREGRLVLHDSLALRAVDGDLAPRLGRFDVLGIALVVGVPVQSHAEAIVTRVAQTPVSVRADLLLAAAPLTGGGCLLRFAGTSVERAGWTLRDYLGFVPALLGDDPWARKW